MAGKQKKAKEARKEARREARKEASEKKETSDKKEVSEKAEAKEQKEAVEQKETGEQKSDVKAQRVRMDDNIVYVGKKPTMSYVLAVITQFSGGIPEVNVKARGRSISRAVDVVEVVRNRFVQGVKYSIDIGTEEIQDEQRSRINVSTITIKLTK